MSQKTFFKLAGLIFALIATGHLFRLINGWPAEVGNWQVPMWISWAALAIGYYMAYQGLRYGKFKL